MPRMRKADRAVGVAACILFLGACSPGTTTTPDGAGAGDAQDTSSAAPTETAPAASASETSSSSSSSAAPAASSAPATTASAKPTSGAPEATKDSNALVLVEITYVMKGGAKPDANTSSELLKTANEQIRSSSVLAQPESKVAKPRKVSITVLLEEPKLDAKGVTIHMGLVGVESAGKCPVFDLKKNFTMVDAKKASDAEVLDLRKQGMVALLKDLEKSAPTMKPAANCTSGGK